MHPSKNAAMKKKFVDRWWIDLPCYACTFLIVQALLRAAGVGGIPSLAEHSFAKFVVWGCCFYVVERAIKFVLWLAVLVAAPERAGEMP